MIINTTFSPGDRIWCTGGDGLPHLLTVGQVQVTVTDSPGRPSDDGIPWDNYKPRKDREERYMCVETGIGSGSVYELGKHAFATREACVARIAAVQQVEERQAHERERDEYTRFRTSKHAAFSDPS